MEDIPVDQIDIEFHNNNCVDDYYTLLSKTESKRSTVITSNAR